MKSKFTLKDYTGVIPAMITIFDKDEQVDEKNLRKFTDYLLDNGSNGLYLTGSTGEGFLMTQEERKKVVEIVLDQVKDRVPVAVHVGAISTLVSIDLAKHAEAHGATAISSVPPFYWKFDEAHIISYYRDIATSVSIPMIVYNVPLAGMMGFSTLMKLAQLPNVGGIKYTANSHNEIVLLKEKLGKDFMIYSGSDEMAVSGLLAGADGIIGSFYNMMPETFVKIYQLYNKGDIKGAMKLLTAAIDIIDVSVKHDYYAVMRCCLKWIGVDAGYSRRPFFNVDSKLEAELKSEYAEIKKRHGLKKDEIKVLRDL